jgi:hypothetical protein
MNPPQRTIDITAHLLKHVNAQTRLRVSVVGVYHLNDTHWRHLQLLNHDAFTIYLAQTENSTRTAALVGARSCSMKSLLPPCCPTLLHASIHCCLHAAGSATHQADRQGCYGCPAAGSTGGSTKHMHVCCWRCRRCSHRCCSRVEGMQQNQLQGLCATACGCLNPACMR